MFYLYFKRTQKLLLAASFYLLPFLSVAQTCTTYAVGNVNNVCGCTDFLFRPYGLYVEAPNGCGVEYYKADTVAFIISSDSTAALIGTFRTFSDWRPVVVNLRLSKTTARLPRLEGCNRDSALSIAAFWQYFNTMSGTITFDNDPPVTVSSRNGLFQMGIGASGQNATALGASGQFTLSNGKTGGFGFTLATPQPTTCPQPISLCAIDAQPPVFLNCPTNIALSTALTTAAATWTPPTATDNCSTPSVSSNFSSGQAFPIGVTNVVYTARDANNNTSQCRFNVTVTQTAPPTGCVKYNVDNTNNLCGCADFLFRPYGIYLETANNCGLEYYKADTVSFQINADSTASLKGTFRSLTWTPIVVDIFFQKTTARLPKLELCNRDSLATIANAWRYFGNMIGTIKIGTDAPVSVSSRNGLFQVGASANGQNGGGLGASGQFSLGNGQRGGFGFSLSNPQTVPCTLPPNFCLNDIIPPSFNNCPSNISINTRLTSAIATWTVPTATDNCSTPSVTSNFSSGQTFSLGTTDVIYTARDSANNRTECRFSVTVNQVMPLGCTRYKLDNTQNICGCPSTQWIPFGLYLDNPTNACGTTYYKADDVAFQINEDSTATLRGTFRSQTWQPVFVNVTFAKTTLKSPRIEGCNRDSASAGAGSWRYFGTMRGIIQFDSSSIYNVNSLSALTQVGLGANNQNGLQLGGNGTFIMSNSQRGGFSFLLTNPQAVACTVEPNPCVNDVTKPVFNSCPSTINVGTYQTTSVATWVVPTAFDNCSTPSVTSNFSSGQVFPVGVTTVAYTAKDASNNVSTCSFAVNVFTLPPPTGCNKYTVENTNNLCGCSDSQYKPYGFYLETVGQACGLTYFKADSVVFQANGDSTGTLRGRFRSDTWQPIYVDLTFARATTKTPRLENCNRDSVAASVSADWRYLGAMSGTIKFDTAAPLSISSRNGGFQFGKSASGQNAGLFGASGQFSLSNGRQGGFAFLLSNSQVADCPFVFNACSRDTIPPVFNNCPSNISVLTSQNSVSINWTMPTARDNCGVPIVLSNFQPGQLLPIGTTTVVYLARDTAGNQTECRFVVTVTKITATQDPQNAAFELVRFAPNPAFDVLTVDVLSPFEGAVDFHLSNVLGQVIAKKTMSLKTGDNQLTFDVSQLPKGVYWLKPAVSNGQKAMIKFLKM